MLSGSEEAYEVPDTPVAIVEGFADEDERDRCRDCVESEDLAAVLRTDRTAAAPSRLGPAMDDIAYSCVLNTYAEELSGNVPTVMRVVRKVVRVIATPITLLSPSSEWEGPFFAR